MEEIIPKILPIILLIILGFVLNSRRYIKQESMNDLKKIVLNIGLPSLIFTIFINIEMKIEILGLTAVNLLYLCVLVIVGYILKDMKGISLPILPYMIPGLSFGTIGIPLFMSVFGTEGLERFSLLDVGHSIFLWFILVVLLKYHCTGEKFSMGILKDFIQNPFIIAVLSGLLMNVSGLAKALSQNVLYNGLLSTLDSLGAIVTPIILIILGYDLRLNKKYIKISSKIVMLRLVIMITVGSIIKVTILNQLMVPDILFDYAWFTYLLLPPSNAIPLFLGQYSTEEDAGIATNTVVLNTIVTIVVYIVFVFYISL